MDFPALVASAREHLLSVRTPHPPMLVQRMYRCLEDVKGHRARGDMGKAVRALAYLAALSGLYAESLEARGKGV